MSMLRVRPLIPVAVSVNTQNQGIRFCHQSISLVLCRNPTWMAMISTGMGMEVLCPCILDPEWEEGWTASQPPNERCSSHTNARGGNAC
jgi:hypothetical protein